MSKERAQAIIEEEVDRVKVVHGIAVPNLVAAGLLARAAELRGELEGLEDAVPEPAPAPAPEEPTTAAEPEELPAPEEPVVSTEDEPEKRSRRNRR